MLCGHIGHSDLARMLLLVACALALATGAARAQGVIFANPDAVEEADDVPAAAPLARAALQGDPQEPDSDSAPSVPAASAPAGELEERTLPGREDALLRSPSGSQSNPAALPSVWRGLGSLLVVLALIGGATWVARRFVLGRQPATRFAGLDILARNPIAAKQSLCLVKLGGRLVLLGLSPNHIAALETVDDPEEIARILGALEQHKPHSISNGFSRLFRRESDQYRFDDLNETEPAGPGERPDGWNEASGELSVLLNKVKGLSRMRLRP